MISNQNFKYLQLKSDELFFNTYSRLNVLIEKGEGVYLVTSEGKILLDMFGGLAVNLLGYNHPKIESAALEQIHKYIHLSNYFIQPKQIELAEKLLKTTGFKKIFFCNSGTEANEAAIKLVRKYFDGSDKKKIFSFTGSFHGRTLGALTLTSRKKYREMFEPLVPDIHHLRFNSEEDLNENINEYTAAIFMEFLQGESGIKIAEKKFIDKIFKLRQKYGFLVVADEIQSGLGRTGKFFAYEYSDVVPDVVLLAKGLGGGFPLGAMLGNEKVMDVFQSGEHGSTFGGNPVAAACGCVVIDELNGSLIANAMGVGTYLNDELNKLKGEYSNLITDVRGYGFMIGVEFKISCKEIVNEMLNHGVLVNCTNTNVIRLLPPLILNINEVSFFLDIFRAVLKNINSSKF